MASDIYIKYELRSVEVTRRNKPVCHGWFHMFSTYADSDGSSPVAIVELENGEVTTVDPTEIRFLDVDQTA